MTAFCTKCGSTLSATTRFCTNCGAETLIDTNQDVASAVVAGGEPSDAAVSGSSKPKKRRRWLWWVLAVILAFALGLLLGNRTAPKCPHCPAPSTAGTGGGGGGGGGGHRGAAAGGKGDPDRAVAGVPAARDECSAMADASTAAARERGT
jgi:hypothetical protein